MPFLPSPWSGRLTEEETRLTQLLLLLSLFWERAGNFCLQTFPPGTKNQDWGKQTCAVGCSPGTQIERIASIREAGQRLCSCDHGFGILGGFRWQQSQSKWNRSWPERAIYCFGDLRPRDINPNIQYSKSAVHQCNKSGTIQIPEFTGGNLLAISMQQIYQWHTGDSYRVTICLK